ncbi:NAD(P)-binding domain-containing protein [Arthrobacter sp. 2RAF6]|uniref:hypothetical protein n=1 Tax=Arthrobacter sp. 2RAF6 TaxID=3233002 RepID=UPI003F916987
MRITVIGRGHVGGALARRWTAAGHDVAFNTNFASIYDAVDAEPMLPGTLFASDADAREATEQLIRDAGFEPIHHGDLAKAPLLESLITLTSTLDRGELGPFFYRFNRFNRPGELAARFSLNPR